MNTKRLWANPCCYTADQRIEAQLDRHQQLSSIQHLIHNQYQYQMKASSKNNQQPIDVKLVIVGHCEAEKCQLLTSYINHVNKFDKTFQPINVFDNYYLDLLIDRRQVRLGLWDTAGAEEYNRLRPLAYPNTDVFLVGFSTTNRSSFQLACTKWYPELRETSEHKPILFVGTRIDEREKHGNSADLIDYKEASKLIKQRCNCQYLECSSRTMEGVVDVFQEAVRMALKFKQVPPIKIKQTGLCVLI